jgi:hypothetical protein
MGAPYALETYRSQRRELRLPSAERQQKARHQRQEQASAACVDHFLWLRVPPLLETRVAYGR